MWTLERKLRVARLILANLEKTLEVLSQRYGVEPQVLQEYMRTIGQVPRAETILAWGLENAQWKVARLPEDLPRLSKAATWLWSKSGDARVKQTLQVEYPDKNPKNLLAYTLHDIESIEAHFAPTKAQDLAYHLPEGSKLLGEHGDLRVVEVTTPEAACTLSKGSKWCTSDPETASRYLEDAPLHVVYKRGQKVAQFHGLTGQLMNLQDKPLSYEQAPQIYDALEEMGLLSKSIASLGHPKYAEDDAHMEKLAREHEKLNTDDELLSPDHRDVPAVRRWALKTPDNARTYAFSAVRGPWPEGESLIAQDPHHAYAYAIALKKSRFPEGEAAIRTHPHFSAVYAKHFLGGHWPKTEHVPNPESHSSHRKVLPNDPGHLVPSR